MSDIQRLIGLLKSDNPNMRYDACEELRVSRQPLTQEAIDALNSATNDSNPDVADAAQRALAIHAPHAKTDVVAEKNKVATDQGVDIRGRDIVIGFFGWVIIHNLLFFLALFLVGFLYNLLDLYLGGPTHVFLVSLTILLFLAISVRILIIRKQLGICGGVITAFVVNALAMIIVSGYPGIAVLPFPLGFIVTGV